MSAVDLLIPTRTREIVPGITVRRVLPWMRRRSIGPFVFLDHMGPMALPPGAGADVGPHPHIGLATITYLFEGHMLHRDSLGTVQAIEPGAVNWMTAGRGIVHSERSPETERRAGVRMHGVQIWVALPEDQEETAPAFAHHNAADLPEAKLGDAHVRMVVGTAFGLRSPVKTLSPMFLAEARLEPGATLEVPGDFPERGVYLVKGAITLNDAEPVTESALAALTPGPVTVRADAPTRLMLLGGTPLGPRKMWWNFVSTRQERIDQAKADWAAGRFPEIPGETGYIPLPDR